MLLPKDSRDDSHSELLAGGKTAEEIVSEFPDLTHDQIAACLDYAPELATFEAVG